MTPSFSILCSQQVCSLLLKGKVKDVENLKEGEISTVKYINVFAHNT
jgi:hypothetical protein